MGKTPRKFHEWLVLGLGTCAFSGFLGPAPGTIGALLGTLAYPFTFGLLGPLKFFLCWGVAVVLSIPVCGRCERILGIPDPGAVNLDEFLAMPLCFWPVQHLCGPISPWLLLPLGFLLFRYFDIRKPLGISSIQRLPGGYGIIFDDLLAASYVSALVCLAVCL
jgi:phosphatidylglycerophosphatase A